MIHTQRTMVVQLQKLKKFLTSKRKLFDSYLLVFSKIQDIDIFKEKYDDIMSDEQMKEAYLFYANLKDKNNIYFKIYTECSSTLDNYNKDNFMMWYPLPLTTFLAKFCILNKKV